MKLIASKLNSPKLIYITALTFYVIIRKANENLNTKPQIDATERKMWKMT